MIMKPGIRTFKKVILFKNNSHIYKLNFYYTVLLQFWTFKKQDQFMRGN